MVAPFFSGGAASRCQETTDPVVGKHDNPTPQWRDSTPEKSQHKKIPSPRGSHDVSSIFGVSLGYCHWFYYGFLSITTSTDDEGVVFMSPWGVVDSRCQSFVSLAFLFVKGYKPMTQRESWKNHHRGKGMGKNKHTLGSSKCVNIVPILPKEPTKRQNCYISGRSRAYFYIDLYIYIYLYIVMQFPYLTLFKASMMASQPTAPNHTPQK